MVEQVSMRKKWFEHVEKTRKKLQRKDKGTTHRAAMKAASVTWPQEKVKIQNKIKREERREAKEAAKASASKAAASPPT